MIILGMDQLRLLILGQIPPPFHGQSVMIEKIINMNSEFLKIHYLKMGYSKEIDEVGRFSFRKVITLFHLLLNVKKIVKENKIEAIYYPPAGTGFIPIIRDIITLLFIRKFGIKLILHFHAMGLECSYKKMGALLRFFFERAYFKPDLCICISESNIDEIKFLQPLDVKVVNYGQGSKKNRATPDANEDISGKIRLLFTGNIIESKGVLVLLNVIERLIKKGYDLSAKFVGGMTSNEIRKKVQNHPAVIDKVVEFVGVKTGEEKNRYFKQADIFCFPTYYENENFPVVIIEAMQFGLPIVTTNWRGIPSMVKEGKNGYLSVPGSVDEYELKLEILVDNEQLRHEMSKESRRIYEENFTEEIYQKNISEAIYSLKA